MQRNPAAKPYDKGRADIDHNLHHGTGRLLALLAVLVASLMLARTVDAREPLDHRKASYHGFIVASEESALPSRIRFLVRWNGPDGFPIERALWSLGVRTVASYRVDAASGERLGYVAGDPGFAQSYRRVDHGDLVLVRAKWTEQV